VEQWLGIDRLEVEHKAILIIEFNQSTIAFPIHNFERIHNVPIENLQTSHCKSDFVTYTTLLEVAGREVTCMVMDVEKLLFDVFGLDGGLFDDGMAEINSCKKAYIAEDSSSARRIVSEIMGKTNIEHRMFNNGKEIIECLKSLDEEGINDIGVIITDLEMPYVDGYQVLSYIKNSPQFKHIPVFVNTSMSNEGVITKVEELGAVGFVAKTNPKEFIRQIEQHILR
jgi:two-component system chemotaxis response regulator CheV